MANTSTDPYPATEPLPLLSERPRWRDTFVSLRSRNYRLYVISQFIANTSGWMQRIATDWLVLELTGSVAMVGITVAMQFGPILLFSPWGGLVADRYDKRRLLLATQTTSALLCALLAALALTGAAQLWHVYAIVLALGFVAVFDGPARGVLVTEMVGQARLRNAISVNASIFHLGGLLGPAVSGVLIVLVGAGWSIGINAVACLVVVLALALMRRSELLPTPRVRRAPGQVREALRYVARKPAILWSMVMLSFVSVFGMSLPVLLAGVAKTEFHTGSSGYGLYSSFVAVGALLGALLSTRRTGLRLRTIVGAAGLYGIAQFFVGVAPGHTVFLALLPAVGAARLLFATAADSMTQLSSNRSIRGRVMSLYVMVLVGGQAVGGPLMGALAELIGPRGAIAVSGAVPALAALVIAFVLRPSDLRRLVRSDRAVALLRRPWRPA